MIRYVIIPENELTQAMINRSSSLKLSDPRRSLTTPTQVLLEVVDSDLVPTVFLDYQIYTRSEVDELMKRSDWIQE
jgi:hypothetical protein